MKVENQNPIHKVDFLKDSIASGQSIVLMRLLQMCAEDIQDEMEAIKLDAGKKEVSASDAPEAPKSSSKNKSAEQILFDSYITALNVNDSLKTLTQDTMNAIMEYAKLSIQELEKLTKQIAELRAELAQLLSKEELKEIQEKLSQLEKQYNDALAQYNAASKNVNDASQKIKALEAKYAGIEDKDSDEAKAIKSEIDATKKEKVTAENQMKKAENSIEDAISQLSALANQFPDFADKMKDIIAIMKVKGSIAGASANLSDEIKKMEEIVNALEEKVVNKTRMQKELIANILSGAEQIKAALEKVGNVESKMLEYKGLKVFIDRVLQSRVNTAEIQEEKLSVDKKPGLAKIKLSNKDGIRPQIRG